MAAYLMLLNWTDQGIRNVKESPKRLDAAKKLAKDLGGEIKTVYMTQGSFDLALITEMPNDEKLASFVLKLGSLGNVRTTTLKALLRRRIPEDYRRSELNRSMPLQVSALKNGILEVCERMRARPT